MCNQLFAEKVYLNTHFEAVHGNRKAFTCTSGEKSFVNSSLSAHPVMEHRDIKVQSLPSTLCGKEFGLEASLNEHVDESQYKKESGMFQCHECSAQFYMKESLEQHVKQHIQETVSG